LGKIGQQKTKIFYLMAGEPLIFGGGKRVFLQLMNHINKSEFRIFSCCAFDNEQENFLSSQGAGIINIDIQHGGIFSSMIKLINLLKTEHYDIIHSQGARADFYARVAVKLSGRNTKVINTIAMLVDGYDSRWMKKIIYCLLDRISEKYADKFIVVSNALKKALISSHNIPGKKINTIYNGIELQSYGNFNTNCSRETRKDLGISDNTFLIGAIGRLVWQKGFEYLLLAFPEIISAYPQSRILIVGDGPLREKLESLCERLNLKDKIVFTGFMNNIKEILSAIDLLAVPSLLEGFPMITLEAMAMAKPIIATNIDGINEQITNGENGILVPPKDPKAIANAVIKLIDNKETAKNMGLAARRKVEQNFSVEKMVLETEKVYLSLLKDKY